MLNAKKTRIQQNPTPNPTKTKAPLILLHAIFLQGFVFSSCDNEQAAQSAKVIVSSEEFDMKAAEAIIRENTNRFTEAHITKVTAFLNHIFTEDANSYPPNSDVVSGRAAIAAINLEWINYEIKEFRDESTSFYGCKEYLIDEGHYYLRYGEDDIIDKGNFVNIWELENEEWKICSNIWNSGLPY